MNRLITTTKLSRLITTAMFGALVLSCGTTSIAATEGDVPQAVVKYGDLNASNPQGAATLYQRIVGAARAVCDPLSADIRDLQSQRHVNDCVRKAIRRAVTDVGQPELFAVYNAKNPQHLPITVAAAQSR